MGLATRHCQNCGAPLEVEPGAASIRCPNCRSINTLPVESAELRSVGLEATNASLPPPAANRAAETPASPEMLAIMDKHIRLESLIAELEHVRDHYRSDFVPARERAERKLDEQAAASEAKIAQAKAPKRTKWLVGAAILFFIGGVGIVNDPGKDSFSGGVAIAFGLVLALVAIWNISFWRERLKALRRVAEWRKTDLRHWREEDEKFKTRMVELSGEIAKLRTP